MVAKMKCGSECDQNPEQDLISMTPMAGLHWCQVCGAWRWLQVLFILSLAGIHKGQQLISW